MAVNLSQMLAYLGVLVQNQLTDEQLRILINLSEIEEIDERSWARLKTEIVVNSFALYSAGTVNVAQGSSSVTGIGTAWTQAMVGMYFRCGTGVGTGGPSAQYAPIPIAAVINATSLLLSTPYPQAAATGLGYQLFPLFYSAPGLRRIIGIRQQVPLQRRNHEYFNYVDPYRSNPSSPSVQWAPFGLDENGNARFELWPIETAANGYTVYGIKDHLDLRNPQDLPLLPSSVLMNKAMVKACETLFAQTGDQRWSTTAERFNGYYTVSLEKALDGDREEYGVIEQVLDNRYSDSGSGQFNPGFDLIYNRDIVGSG